MPNTWKPTEATLGFTIQPIWLNVCLSQWVNNRQNNIGTMVWRHNPTSVQNCVSAADKAWMETMLAGQNTLAFEYCVHIHGMGQSMLGSPEQQFVWRTQGQIWNHENETESRGTGLDWRTQCRDIDPIPTRQMETETAEESSKFRHCVLASTQQNTVKITQRGKVLNILVTLTSPEDYAAANTRFITKIAKAKRRMLQDGRMDDGQSD